MPALLSELAFGSLVFVGAMVLGYFLFPAIMPLARLKSWMTHSREAEVRDAFFRPLTNQMERLRLLPNHVTLGGFALTVLLAFLFAQDAHPGVLVAVALAAGLSDMVDGPLARNAGKVSAIGGFLDGLRDVALFVVLSLGMISLGLLRHEFFLWFSLGYVFSGFLKLIEVLAHASSTGYGSFYQNLRLRVRGVGKFPWDRFKIAFYMIGLILLFGFAFSLPVVGVVGEFMVVAAIATTFLATSFHAANIKIIRAQL